MTDLVVGLDVGTTGARAVAVDRVGSVVRAADEPYPVSAPEAGWSEQDPEDWYRAATSVLERVAAPAPAAIGLSGQMHGLTALDRSAVPVRPAILWNDERAVEECREIEATVGRERLEAVTGSRALPGFTAPKLRWLERHEPAVFDRIAHVVLPKDFVRLRLTGEIATDVTDASGTLWFDAGAREWSLEIAGALGVDAGWLPTPLESAEVSGKTPEGVRVAGGAGDQAAAATGVGAVRPGVVSVVLGTSGVVFRAADAFAPDTEQGLQTGCHAVEGTWQSMGVVLAAGGALRWARDVLAPGASLDELVREAASAPAGSGGVVFVPHLSGERSPHLAPEARGAFVGLRRSHDRSHLIRAVLEGVAFALRDVYVALGGGATADVRVTGGGARSDLWLSIVASVLGVTVSRTSVDEGSAYGAAAIAAASAAWFDGAAAAADSWVRIARVVEPVTEWTDAYEHGYARYRAAYPATQQFDAPTNEEA